MNTELKNAIEVTDRDAQYDESAKRLLGQKSILAHILVKTVDEFKGMNPRDVVSYIEGAPYIGTVPVEAGYDIKRVYSIWVCMNMDENSMNYIHLINDSMLGNCEWKGKLDLLNIVMIGLAGELPPHDECYELHRLLGALLSKELTVDEKLNIIGTEYDIPMEEHFRKDVSVMCNLSQGIKEDGIAIGESIGEARIIINMHDSGFTAQQIADVTKKI